MRVCEFPTKPQDAFHNFIVLAASEKSSTKGPSMRPSMTTACFRSLLKMHQNFRMILVGK